MIHIESFSRCFNNLILNILKFLFLFHLVVIYSTWVISWQVLPEFDIFN